MQGEWSALGHAPPGSPATCRYTPGVDDFDDVARVRTSYNAFVEAMSAGREIMRRAGVPDPPPIPGFDTVFQRLNTKMRNELYAVLRQEQTRSPADVIRLWQPLIRRAFGVAKL